MRYEAKFVPTVDDILTAYRMHNRQSNDSWKLYVFGAVGVAVVFGVAAFVMEFLFIGVLGVIVGCLAFGSTLLPEWTIRRHAKSMKAEEVAYLVSDEGVEFSSSVARSKLSWDVFIKATLDDRGLLLYTAPLSYSFIPARAFVSGYFPRQELKTFLSQKLKGA